MGVVALASWGWKTVSNIVRVRDSLLDPKNGVLARLQEVLNILNPPGQPSINERLANLEHQDQRQLELLDKNQAEVDKLRERFEEHLRSPNPHPGWMPPHEGE